MKPALSNKLWGSDKDWNLTTVPQVHAMGRVMNQPRGKILVGENDLWIATLKARAGLVASLT